MKEIGAVLGAAILALAIIAASLALFDDHSTLTSPPDAVAEGFIRMVESGRYERALPYLDDSLLAHVDTGVLRDLAHRLQRRTGSVMLMSAEPVRMEGDRALAAVLIQGELADSVRLELPLSFASGVWSIAGLGGLADTAWNGERETALRHEP